VPLALVTARFPFLVVPGYTPRFGWRGGLHPRAALRLERARLDLEAGLAPQVIVSGAAVHSADNEAALMRDWLLARGIAPERIVVEDVPPALPPRARLPRRRARLARADARPLPPLARRPPSRSARSTRSVIQKFRARMYRKSSAQLLLELVDNQYADRGDGWTAGGTVQPSPRFTVGAHSSCRMRRSKSAQMRLSFRQS
jgi:DUF218 domain